MAARGRAEAVGISWALGWPRALYRDMRWSEGNDLPETRPRTWIGSVEDLAVLEHALADGEPLVREHAAWARERIAPRANAGVITPHRYPIDLLG